MEVGCGFKLQAASGDVHSEGGVWDAEQVLGGVVLRGDGRGEGLRDIGRGEWVRGDTGQPTDDDQQGGGSQHNEHRNSK